MRPTFSSTCRRLPNAVSIKFHCRRTQVHLVQVFVEPQRRERHDEQEKDAKRPQLGAQLRKRCVAQKVGQRECLRQVLHCAAFLRTET